jgi:hypothetical protein
VLTDTATVAGVLFPDVGDMESQLPPVEVLADAVQDRLALVLLTVKFCEANVPLVAPLKEREAGVTVNTDPVVTFSVTVTVWLVNPGAVKTTDPVYCPEVSTLGEF